MQARPDEPLRIVDHGHGLSVAATPTLQIAVSGTIVDGPHLAGRLGLAADAGPAALVLGAYQQLGRDWLDAVRGSFALIVCDQQRARVFAVRDPMGLHPLFFVRDGRSLLFSWSTDALLAQPAVSGDLNRVLLAEHLLHRWSDARETYLLHVTRVPGGHVLEATSSDVTQRRYWDPAVAGQHEGSEESQIALFERAFDRAVLRCLAEGPTAIWLSGGLDSISVAAVAADVAARAGALRPHALSLGFPDPACNEEPVQRGVAAALGLSQDYVPFDATVGERGLLPLATELAATWPMPMTNLWNPAYSELSRRGRARGCRVILTGNGGDEWLTVSPFLTADLIREGRLGEALRFIRVLARSHRVSPLDAYGRGIWTFGLRPLAVRALARAFPAAFQARRMRNMAAAIPAWVAPDPALRRAVQDRADRVLAAPTPGATYYEREMRTALDHPLNAIEAEEYFEMGRRLGMQIRHPYWDADLVEVLYRVPPHVLSKGGRSKGLVRETLARRFPTLGFERQRKVHATYFYRRTMRAQGPAAWASLGGARTLASLGVVDARMHAAAMDRLFAGQRATESYRIWTTLQLEAWARRRVRSNRENAHD